MSESAAAVAITTVLSILVIVDIVGNCLVCATIRKNRDMRTPMNYLLVNLAIADILYATFITPKIVMSVNLSHPEGVYGAIICKLLTGGSIAWIGAFSSIPTLAAIAIERYYAVIYPYSNKGKLTTRKLKVIIPGIWIFSVTFLIPIFLVMKVKGGFCVDSWPEPWMVKAYHLAVDVLVFLPLTLMVVLYSRVVYTLWLKRSDENQLNHQQIGVARVRKRVTLMVVTVSIIFGVSWGTMQVLYFLFYFASYTLGPVTIAVTNTMVLFNSAVNPFVYALLNQQFRRKMKRMIYCSKSSAPRVQSDQDTQDTDRTTNTTHSIQATGPSQE
ncbi:hypothetical protein ACROYT_G035276 [Oculina patagonica]